MATYFISDIHLSEQEPHLASLFARFLSQYVQAGDSLYLLGDLFALWIGDDDVSPFHQGIITALADLNERGIQAFLLVGNRDFLIRSRFAKAARLTLLPEKYLLALGGERLLLLHGDTLCTLDHGYQRFRRKVQQPWLQWLFLHLPLRWRRKIAAKLRQQSGQNSNMSVDAMDVVTNAVLADCQQYQATTMIHGHTHRPGIHWYGLNGSRIGRYTLSDWGQEGNYLKIDAEGHKTLEYFA